MGSNPEIALSQCSFCLLKSLYKVSLLTLALIAWLACFLHPLPIHYPSITHPLPIITHPLPIHYPSITHHYPSITHLLPIHYPSLPIYYPSITHHYPSLPIYYPSITHHYPSRNGSSHWRVTLTLDTYFLVQFWATKVFTTAVQITIIKCLRLLPSFSLAVCVLSVYTHQSIAFNRMCVVAHALCSRDCKITIA